MNTLALEIRLSENLLTSEVIFKGTKFIIGITTADGFLVFSPLTYPPHVIKNDTG